MADEVMVVFAAGPDVPAVGLEPLETALDEDVLAVAERT
jgi:hypothetical protein